MTKYSERVISPVRHAVEGQRQLGFGAVGSTVVGGLVVLAAVVAVAVAAAAAAALLSG